MNRPGACDGAGIARVTIARVAGSVTTAGPDDLSVERPLEILVIPAGPGAAPRSLAVTMRTPGDDLDLVAGFLLTEGIVREPDDLVRLAQVGPNAVEATLGAGARLETTAFERHSFVSSSCGACGKRLIESLRVAGGHRPIAGTPRVRADVVHALPGALRAAQPEFSRTGGIHASGLFDPSGRVLDVREDVGRHNALDKLLGAALRAGRVPLRDGLVLVSGRVGFELVQKVALAGVSVLCAVGAPSSMAVEVARELGVTLLGFVREGRFNVYADDGRVA